MPGLSIIPKDDSGLAGRGERPGSLRIQLGLRCRCRWGCRLLGRLSFFCWGCLLHSGLLRSRFFRSRLFGCRLFGRSFFGSWLLSSDFLLRCWLLRCSLLHSRLFSSDFLLRYWLLRCSLLHSRLFNSDFLLRCWFLRCRLFRRSLLHSRLFSGRFFSGRFFRSGLFGRSFFRSCHCFLLDQVAKSTSTGHFPEKRFRVLGSRECIHDRPHDHESGDKIPQPRPEPGLQDFGVSNNTTFMNSESG